MATHIRPLELDALCERLDVLFAGQIVGTGSDPDSRRSNYLSKAIAAFVLHEEGGASVEEAVSASIDGGQDHGIDSVFVSPDRTLWLIQSKYIAIGVGEPNLGEVAKFRDGVVDLLNGNWARFNQTLQAKDANLKSALNHPDCRVRVVLAHTGGAISDDRRNIFGDLERAFNGPHPGLVRCFSYGLSTLHDIHIDSLAISPIEVEIELQDFGLTLQPYRAYYGRMSARRLTELWQVYQDQLVERNIRRFKGSTTVNEGLQATLHDEPSHFFYFNNGVTFLCTSIQQQHPRDPNRHSGRFLVGGLSIINGAQTVGVIAREAPAFYDGRPAEVLATFVCLEAAPERFGEQVTQTRNRQNRVELDDFAGIDERQANWQRTLEMSGIEYVVQQGANAAASSANCFSVREAAPFLACTVTSVDWQEFVVAAKSDRRRLFGRRGLVVDSDPLCDAYDRIFPDSLTAKHLWRAVQVGRFVLSAVRARSLSEADPANLAVDRLRAREILAHGAWLLLHVLSVRPALHLGPELTLTAAQDTQLSTAVDLAAQLLVTLVQSQAWGKQARSLFDNRTDCREVKARLMAALT